MEIKTIGFWGAYPEKGEATSCYLVKKNNFHLVIDLGSGALSRLQHYIDIKDINAVVLSHFHNDHIADVGAFQYACLVQQQLKQLPGKIPIYASTDNPRPFEKLNHQATEARAFDERKKQQIGPFYLSFLETKHPKPCYAMRIECGDDVVVYTADTSYFKELVEFSKDADLLIAETSFYRGMDGSKAGHMTSDDVAKLAQKANVNEVWLTHLPHFGEHDQLLNEVSEGYDGPIQLAKEGLTWRS
ncbi:MBL fold metallo-hydrolase [Aquisalibacillus elongatus]|uniref:Ribonuclease BN (tRNA processing enzyme) n=1 Tax=Aquisalibacillus elongatus TaxID=485577 RepID=A0A3N5C6K3_9BACI|nr:MBL fold metallo-hydrolase [Aquisalibacillus elongatus]RPF52041.1 ribonuclease BN (tRNA processing enzyme) [Aquisalibacillus elongatus]